MNKSKIDNEFFAYLFLVALPLFTMLGFNIGASGQFKEGYSKGFTKAEVETIRYCAEHPEICKLKSNFLKK